MDSVGGPLYSGVSCGEMSNYYRANQDFDILPRSERGCNVKTHVPVPRLQSLRFHDKPTVSGPSCSNTSVRVLADAVLA